MQFTKRNSDVFLKFPSGDDLPTTSDLGAVLMLSIEAGTGILGLLSFLQVDLL